MLVLVVLGLSAPRRTPQALQAGPVFDMRLQPLFELFAGLNPSPAGEARLNQI